MYVCTWSCLLCFAFANIPVKAGPLMVERQSILSFMTQTFEIDGDIYAISGGYRSKAREYLSRDDVNISGNEAASYISAAKSDIYGGRAYSYLTKDRQSWREHHRISRERRCIRTWCYPINLRVH